MEGASDDLQTLTLGTLFTVSQLACVIASEFVILVGRIKVTWSL
jgi:hypothetical protein